MKICREWIYSLLGLGKGRGAFHEKVIFEQLEQSQILDMGSRTYRSPENSSLNIRTTSLKVKDQCAPFANCGAAAVKAIVTAAD